MVYWQRHLARVQTVVTELRTRPGDWARDLAQLKLLEQDAVDNIQRLS